MATTTETPETIGIVNKSGQRLVFTIGGKPAQRTVALPPGRSDLPKADMAALRKDAHFRRLVGQKNCPFELPGASVAGLLA